MRRQAFWFASIGILALLVLGAMAFRREYVLPAGSLVGVSAVETPSAVVVSGSIYSSAAKVVKVTTTRDSGHVLIRVYASAIQDLDGSVASGVFRVVVPLDADLREVAVGDGSHLLTIGSVFGWPVRVPRLQVKTPPCKVVWQRS